ncbi:MAG: dihydrodipicolinate synthase family protein [Jatrophihabitans sp.]
MALVTPFRDGVCDLVSLKRLCAHLLDAGVDGFLVCGTTGEGSLLSDEERALVVSAAASVAGDRVMAAAFGPSATEIVASGELLRDAGATSLAVLSPSYVSITQDELSTHFSAIADASTLPIVLYNYPGQTPTSISTDVTLELATHPNVVGTKQSRPTLDQDFLRLITTAQPDFPVLVGNPLLVLPAASVGASGGILAVANVEPQLVVELWRLIADQQWQAAREHHRRIWPRLSELHGSGPRMKTALCEAGLIASPELRAPIGAIGSAAQDADAAAGMTWVVG